jgi:hypothetical protein
MGGVRTGRYSSGFLEWQMRLGYGSGLVHDYIFYTSCILDSALWCLYTLKPEAKCCYFMHII